MDGGATICLLGKDENIQASKGKLFVDYNFGKLIFEDKVQLPDIGPAWTTSEEFLVGMEVENDDDPPVDCCFSS